MVIQIFARTFKFHPLKHLLRISLKIQISTAVDQKVKAPKDLLVHQPVFTCLWVLLIAARMVDRKLRDIVKGRDRLILMSFGPSMSLTSAPCSKRYLAIFLCQLVVIAI